MSNTEIVDYIKKSFELKNQGFYKPAIEMLYKALSIDNENLEILVQLAHLYKLLDNFQRSIYYIEKVLDLNPNHLDCLCLLEEIYLQQTDLKAAREISERIYEIQPTPENLAQKINILNKLHDFDEVKNLEKSVANINDEVLYEIACAYYDNYDREKALEVLENASKKNNKNIKIMLMLGKIYYENQEFEKSQKVFADLETTNPSGEVYNYLGLFKLNESRFTQAVGYFTKAQEADSLNAEYAYNLASAYFLNGWFDEALKCFNQAICLDSENINYHFSLAYLYYQKKMYDKAQKELDFIYKLEQHHELSNVLRAMIAGKNGDLLGAKAELEKIIKFNDSDDFAYSALSQVYKELTQPELAKQSINKAIEINPTSLNYLIELVEIEVGQKNYEDALKIIDKILQINGKYIQAHIFLAKINLEQKDFDEVYEAAQKIIKLDSNCAQGYYYNALALFEQGDKDFALESLKKSISLDLNNAALYIKMSEFYQDLGDLKNAYVWAKEACEIDEQNYKYKWLCAKISASLHNNDAAKKHYSQSYRLAAFDKDLCKDYAYFLNSIGEGKKAQKMTQFLARHEP